MAFAGITAAVTSLPPHRTWGTIAAVAYGLGALAALVSRGRRHPGAVAGAVLAGAVLVPLAVLIGTGQAQPEVDVVHRSGAHLLEQGTPYLGPAELAEHDGYEAYNPYLPGMAVLGLPWALAGVDARLVFGGLFLGLLAASAAVAAPRTGTRPWILLAASPLVALPLAVGGDDLPVIGLACLGLALAVRDRPGLAGAALGAAATLKATAWPALLVCLVLVAVRGAGRGYGRRRRGAWRGYAASAGAFLAAGVALPALADPAGMFHNTVRFPLGLAAVSSPAGSPLPGRLLADLGPYGHAAALAALVTAALAMGASLLVRPPAGARAAAYRLALGLLLATALMPASRWGYLVYPAVLALWGRIIARPVSGIRPAVRVRPRPAEREKEAAWLAA
ncbi:glycosyltransferase 87 family protein [Actinomadura viridis]|uniref:glycosyltransferase 87 family protein n=1 Tax=Actinomadura viridis TaxID=58110 RepID=UPI0036C66345